MQRIRILRIVGVMMLLFVLTTAMYAFTAGNTFADDATRAGNGGIQVSGYEVSGITYTFAGGNAAVISAVAFDLDAAAENVSVRLNEAGTWAPCESTENDPEWECAISIATADLEHLEVAAAE